MEIKKNGEGYQDPTAYEAIINADRDTDKVRRLIRTIFYICDLAGFRVEGRITLVDKKTNKTWR